MFRFLLVSLNIDAILQGTTISRRRRKLDAMNNVLGLEDAYSETLSRITGQGEEEARLGMATLMWISHSERPLKADELCHALSVEVGSPNLDDDNVPSISTLLGSCQGLVTVDKEASTVRLIHFTLQEYLRAQPQLFSRAHSTMAETCLSYLNSHQVKAITNIYYWNLWGIPFLEYSSLYWGVHAKRDLSDCARLLALELFDNYSNHISSKVLLNAQKFHYVLVNFDKPSRLSGLHCASFFGIVEIVAGFVEMEDCDINQTGFGNFTPLMWAALNGQEEVVKILLGRNDVNPDKPDFHGQTPLWGAAWNGHEGVVKVLLGRDDVNPNNPDLCGRTPLFGAASRGHEGVVKILLKQDNIDPNSQEIDSETPLWRAARNGHEGVVKLLLDRDDVNPGKPDKRGRTPLSRATAYGHTAVISLLQPTTSTTPNTE